MKNNTVMKTDSFSAKSIVLLLLMILFVPAVSYAGWTWTQQTSAGNRDWGGITSSSDGTKLAAAVSWGTDGSGGYIYTSTDSGATWTEQTSSGSRYWGGITSSSDGTKLAAGDEVSYIYTSTDSGATWIERTSSDSRFWQSITSSSDGTKLAAGDGWGTDGSGGYI
ncbi:MAG: exo-alpha-sialidase [Nitrospirae bacterium]|nr:exo-alpha-sialidase [Nitrospirota bacterium]